MKVMNVLSKIEKTIVILVNYFLWFAVIINGIYACCAYSPYIEMINTVACFVFAYVYIKKFILKTVEIWKG